MTENCNIKKLRSKELSPDMLADMSEHVLRALGFNIAEDLNDRLDASRIHAGALDGLVRAFQAVEGLQADGLAGKSTLERIRHIQGAGAESRVLAAVQGGAVADLGKDIEWEFFLPTDPALEGTDSYGLEYPVQSADVARIFGKAGTENSQWFRENIIVCRMENGHRQSLPGVDRKRWVKVHRLVEPFFREALRRSMQACPDYFELFGGTIRFGAYNYRRMRHDPNAPLSKHSWGICCDIEPTWNSAITFRKGECPAPWSPAWWKVYPRGIPRAIAHAFHSCGFAWGGDLDADGMGNDQTLSDPMHFQWYGYAPYAAAAQSVK